MESTLFTSSMIRENDIPSSFLDSFELHYDEKLVTIDTSRDIDDLFDRNLLPPSSPVGGSEEDSIIIDNEYAECLFKLNDEDDIDTSIVVVKDEDNSVILPTLTSPTFGKKRKREYETRSKMRNKKLFQERDDNFWQELNDSHSVQEVRRKGTRISIVLEKEYRI